MWDDGSEILTSTHALLLCHSLAFAHSCAGENHKLKRVTPMHKKK